MTTDPAIAERFDHASRLHRIEQALAQLIADTNTMDNALGELQTNTDARITALEGALFAARDAIKAAAQALEQDGRLIDELRAVATDHCGRFIRIEEDLRQLKQWRSEREGDGK